MGFLSNLFSGQLDYEHQLENTYAEMFQTGMGMSATEARATARNMLHEVKDESQRSGTANMPRDYGDRLLAQELTDPSVKEKVTKKREEGVTDADIKWWWNLPDIERRLMDKVDELNRIALFKKSLDDGLTPEQAAATVRKYHPMYGDPTNISHTAGDDRPLPYELKDRINRYVEKRIQNDPSAYKTEIEKSSTFNALIRSGIRNRQI